MIYHSNDMVPGVNNVSVSQFYKALWRQVSKLESYASDQRHPAAQSFGSLAGKVPLHYRQADRTPYGALVARERDGLCKGGHCEVGVNDRPLNELHQVPGIQLSHIGVYFRG